MQTSQPRRRRLPVLLPLATLLGSAALVVGSGAEFTSRTANPTNVASSGTLTQSNTLDNAAIFTGANLRPGDMTTGEVTIANTGSLAGSFSLSETDVASTFSSGIVSLTVTDTTNGTTVYDGGFGGAGTIGLGSFAAGESRNYRFVVALSAAAGNVDQEKTASATYQWDAVPTR